MSACVSFDAQATQLPSVCSPSRSRIEASVENFVVVDLALVRADVRQTRRHLSCESVAALIRSERTGIATHVHRWAGGQQGMRALSAAVIRQGGSAIDPKRTFVNIFF